MYDFVYSVSEVLSVQPDEMVNNLRELSGIYNILVGDARCAIVMSGKSDASSVLHSALQELGTGIISLVHACKAVKVHICIFIFIFIYVYVLPVIVLLHTVQLLHV